MPEVAVIGVGVIGVGAVGTVAASAAEQAGRDVFICGRSPVGGPVVLELDGDERRIAAPVIYEVDEARPVDWVLLATRPSRHRRPVPGWLGCAIRAPWWA